MRQLLLVDGPACSVPTSCTGSAPAGGWGCCGSRSRTRWRQASWSARDPARRRRPRAGAPGRGTAGALRPRQRRRRRSHLAPPAGARRALDGDPPQPPRLRRQPAAATRRLRGRGAALRPAARRRRPPGRPFLWRRDCPPRRRAPPRGRAFADDLRARHAAARGDAGGGRDDRPRRAALRRRRLALSRGFPALVPLRRQLGARDAGRVARAAAARRRAGDARAARLGGRGPARAPRRRRLPDPGRLRQPLAGVRGRLRQPGAGAGRGAVEGKGHSVPETGEPYNELLERFLSSTERTRPRPGEEEQR